LIKKTLSFLLVITFILSCNESGTDPIDNTEPGRRDYIWTEDTLDINSLGARIGRIWGQSPNDIWAIGTSARGREKLWHYDGNSWRSDSTVADLLMIGPYALGGSELSSNIWIGAESQIWRYIDNEWILEFEPEIEGYSNVNLSDIWGIGNGVYAAGFTCGYIGNNYIYRGVIYNYNGNQWQLLNYSNNIEVVFGFIRYRKTPYNIFVTGTEITDTGLIEKLYSIENNTLIELYSGRDFVDIFHMGNEVYLLIGKIIYKYYNNNLVVWKDFSNTSYLGRLWGESEADIFVQTSEGIGHYNGTDIITIYETDLQIKCGIRFNNEIFIALQNQETDEDIIIHGKLGEESLNK